MKNLQKLEKDILDSKESFDNIRKKSIKERDVLNEDGDLITNSDDIIPVVEITMDNAEEFKKSLENVINSQKTYEEYKQSIKN